MFVSDKWQDYEILYAGGGEKYERWGDITLRRPWILRPYGLCLKTAERFQWMRLNDHAPFITEAQKAADPGPSSGLCRNHGRLTMIHWERSSDSLLNLRHSNIQVCFPEQAANWDFCGNLIDRAVRSGRDDIKVLNLFAYTGAATVACSAHGAAEVVHVDASKGMIGRAKENMAESGIADRFVRFIADDCRKFVEREIRRGHRYDGIIMDPPSYGRGPSGELWKLEDSFYDFARMASMLLTDNPLFFIASSYATGITCEASGQILSLATSGTGRTGKVSAGELGLHVSGMGVNLPCGSVARWTET